jgi:hypothetical protein
VRRSIRVQRVPELGCRAIIMDNEVFDWGMDEESLRQAVFLSKTNQEMKEAFINDIQQNLVTSFSEFVGKPCTLLDINMAIENGHIDV